MPIITAGEESCRAASSKLREKVADLGCIILRNLEISVSATKSDHRPYPYRLLVVTVRSGDHLRNRCLVENEVQPIQIGFVGVRRGAIVGFERRKTASATRITICSRSVNTVPNSTDL